MNELKDQLRELRHARGLSQRDLGEMANISEPMVSHIETGRRLPSADTLEDLIRVFELDPGAADVLRVARLEALSPPDDPAAGLAALRAEMAAFREEMRAGLAATREALGEIRATQAALPRSPDVGGSAQTERAPVRRGSPQR